MVDLQHIEAWPGILHELAASDPKARQAKPDDFVDMRFVAELEKDGFFGKLGPEQLNPQYMKAWPQTQTPKATE